MRYSWGIRGSTVVRMRCTTQFSTSELAIALSLAAGPRLRSHVAGPPPDESDPERERIRALVDLACKGDAEAFGQLYDHYLPYVYRFIYHRVGVRVLAEDLSSETFTRALRVVSKFQWQGKDFGAWLTVIARNLIADHFKSSRHRGEVMSGELPERPAPGDGPEGEVVGTMTGELLMKAVRALPDEQRDCLLMRFVERLSISQTAEVLGRSDGAIKQLQLRAIRRLRRELPKDFL